ncbi:hypothetical protein HKBW3S03_00385 [Candidatus Hakubella thermalkaliphila]|uniref:Uncharacterized protein n=1 Tax=Candidatus Hakubella thermalkaliphila TaxID=2754717 RepID=A0A6V8PVJ9_9ACTN|nr:hypothetical protein HKBW3S03_00385 [Candidatus Hakubella thermalkaliphila]GFP30035.1 hypothetical protein HKBW3S34_00955 [Candidatus Hakubella thermalkaliphila]GFP36639.1 hypothetical protein HKBW3S44_00320 [Candidatus Hakubella thermalkaliphila]
MLIEDSLLLFAAHHRGKLVQVANEDHLDAPERNALGPAVHPQEVIDAVQKIGSHHRDFVDHDGVYLRVDWVGDSFDIHRRHVRRESEERVDRLAGNVDGRHPGWRQNDSLFPRNRAEMLEQGGFSGAGSARNENVFIALLHQVERFFEKGI